MNKLKPNKCLKCGKVLDGCSSLEDDTLSPNPGDITVCYYCGEIYKFSKELDIEAVSKSEFKTFEKSLKKEIINIQKLIKKKNKLLNL